MLTSAVVYGLSAAVPPFGAVAIPAYIAYGYLGLGQGLFKAYKELREEGPLLPALLRRPPGPSWKTFLVRLLILSQVALSARPSRTECSVTLLKELE